MVLYKTFRENSFKVLIDCWFERTLELVMLMSTDGIPQKKEMQRLYWHVHESGIGKAVSWKQDDLGGQWLKVKTEIGCQPNHGTLWGHCYDPISSQREGVPFENCEQTVMMFYMNTEWNP